MPHLAPTLGLLLIAAAPAAADTDWPSYAGDLQATHYSPLARIDRGNVARLAPVCTYDLGIETSFQTAPVVVGRTMIATSEFETVALDATDCRQIWRVKEDYVPASMLKVNRGAAVLDGRVFRGTLDGRVLAYDLTTGRRLWAVTIADVKLGETVPAAPIAWQGLVFIGQAGGDNKGVKGRIYALDAATGRIVWEQYLVPRAASDPSRGPAAPPPPAAVAASWGNAGDVPISGGATWTSYSLDPASGTLYVPGGNPAPDFARALRPGDNLFASALVALDARTGAYRRHASLVPEDFHDWDVAAPAALIGDQLIAVAPKDGQLHGLDRRTMAIRWTATTTTRENMAAPLTAAGTRFCPGTQGGIEWNGPGYSPRTGLVYTAAVDWCTTVVAAPEAKIRTAAVGQPWSGNDDDSHIFGRFDDPVRSKGWLQATDARTGAVRWRYQTRTPLLSAVTATAGDLVFFGDLKGTLFAFDATNGRQLWSSETGGALAGGIATYEIAGRQYVAAASGMSSPIWSAPRATAKLIVYALDPATGTSSAAKADRR